MELVDEAAAHAGRGLEGDRYFDHAGTFSNPHSDGHDLTLIEAEVVDELGLPPAEARRNVVTRGIDLNALVGRRFRVGEAECVGRRLCEPCAHLQRLTHPGILRDLVHRGGLRADVLRDGAIRGRRRRVEWAPRLQLLHQRAQLADRQREAGHVRRTLARERAHEGVEAAALLVVAGQEAHERLVGAALRARRGARSRRCRGGRGGRPRARPGAPSAPSGAWRAACRTPPRARSAAAPRRSSRTPARRPRPGARSRRRPR